MDTKIDGEWVYFRLGPSLWAVGLYSENGEWPVHSVHDSLGSAVRKVEGMQESLGDASSPTESPSSAFVNLAVNRTDL